LTDFATADKLKGLQQQEGVGPSPRKQGDELWKRFRACDRFFERRKPLWMRSMPRRPRTQSRSTR
jgi:hypothetical protein